MAWGVTRERSLLLKGGDDCPVCKAERSLCLTNLNSATLDSQIVHCNSCGKNFCAKCKRETVASEDRPNKVLCPYCDVNENSSKNELVC